MHLTFDSDPTLHSIIKILHILDCGLKYLFFSFPTQDGIVCSVREGDDIDGNELIQKQSTVAPVILTEEVYHVQAVTEENFSRIRKVSPQ